MKDLFYSPEEKIAFWVCGYADSTIVPELIKILSENSKKFMEAVGESELKNIRSYMIEESLCYKSMRVFYCSMDVQPKSAFVINNWTMEEWLRGRH